MRTNDLVSGYWANHQMSRAYAVDHGFPGALEGYQRVLSAENYGLEYTKGLHNLPIWGLVPRTYKNHP